MSNQEEKVIERNVEKIHTELVEKKDSLWVFDSITDKYP